MTRFYSMSPISPTRAAQTVRGVALLASVLWGSPALAQPAAAPDFFVDCDTVNPTWDTGVHAAAIRGADSNVLLTALGSRGIFETSDRGATWEKITPQGVCHLPIRAFFGNTPKGDTLCVVTQDTFAPNAFCSHDHGQTFRNEAWIENAEHVLHDPTESSRTFGWSATDRCDTPCAGPMYAVLWSGTRSLDRLCACDVKLAHTGPDNPHLLALLDDGPKGAHVVSFTRDMRQTHNLFRTIDPKVTLTGLFASPFNAAQFLVTGHQDPNAMGGLGAPCCDVLYETQDGGTGVGQVSLSYGPLTSAHIVNGYGRVVGLAPNPHTPDAIYIVSRNFNDPQWSWHRAPERQGTLLTHHESGPTYFAGEHLYRLDGDTYRVIDPVR